MVKLHLNKKESVWWNTSSPLEGLEGIPEGSTEAERDLNNLPTEEQGEIRKIMFDAEQKATGKPTSDAIVSL